MNRLTEEDRSGFLAQHPGWTIEGETLAKTFAWEDFNEALGFVMRVGVLSEVADHHPDIDIRWNRVSIALSTHSAGVLTTKDTELATKIESL